MTEKIPKIESWNLYFTAEEQTVYNKDVKIITDVIECLRTSHGWLLEQKRLAEKKELEIPHSFYEKYPNLRCIACAATEVQGSRGEGMQRIRAIVSLEEMEEKNFEDVTVSAVGELVRIKGTVCRVGAKKIENHVLVHECIKCQRKVRQKTTNNLYRVPGTCVCKSKQYVVVRHSAENICVERQEIKIQDMNRGGRPRVLTGIIESPWLVGHIAPGDVVDAVGTIVGKQHEENYTLEIHINNLIKVNYRCRNITSNEHDRFSSEHVLSSMGWKDLFKEFIETWYEEIVGLEKIKRGLIVALFGGVKRYTQGASLVRGEIHVLILGDPGLGKSRLLTETVRILPKSTLVTGSLSTATGLTVSILHDPATGEFMADAGALVMADGGVCCIDEFEKFSDHSALLEAMDETTVTVAKGNLVATVPAACTVVAAGNFRRGHYNPVKSLRENISIDGNCLSRFDLVYIIRDDFTAKENLEISRKIITKQSVSSNDDLLLAYLHHARTTIFPVISSTAEKRLKKYFTSIRPAGATIRHLETLMRLTEALARMRLSHIASDDHAVQAIEIFSDQLLLLDKSSQSSRSHKKSIEELLADFKAQNGSLITVSHLTALLASSGSSKSPHVLIRMLNHQGLLIKTSATQYKIN